MQTRLAGGEGGIRTPDTRQGMSAFEADRFNHSRTSPRRTAVGRRSSFVRRTWNP